MCDYDHPSVFDPHFYLNNWPDLEHHGLHTKEAAAQHWCDHGVDEGRQATATFHTKQYLGIYCYSNGCCRVMSNILLANYPDLQEVFGNDYRAVVLHYLYNGLLEGRDGYTIGGGQGRWTIRSAPVSGSAIYLSSSERTAGAIDSLVWRDREFLNSWDHGRQLQMAITVQNHGECWNPTEAGGRSDGIDFETKSNLTFIL